VDSTTRLFPAGRSRGVTVAIDGFFAFVWFGWGQADAPSWLVIPLTVGIVLGTLLAVTGVVVARRSAGPLPAASDPAVRRRYAIAWRPDSAPGTRPRPGRRAHAAPLRGEPRQESMACR